jgi:hypothetical protein
MDAILEPEFTDLWVVDLSDQIDKKILGRKLRN